MSLILNDIHLPLLIKTTLSENHQYKTLPWNNLDQLSSLWAVFTKYKRNIQDGFRLENLSWRLWYRQSVLQKKVEPKTSEDIDFSTASASTSSKHLTRTRSLPDLSQWSQQKQLLETSDQDMHVKQKFFISAKDGAHLNENDEDMDEEEGEEEDDDEDKLEEEPEQLMFTKTTTRFNSFSSTASSALSKPVSLLTDMLQRTESNVSLVTNSGLRRCQSKYCRLDQFFLNAA